MSERAAGRATGYDTIEPRREGMDSPRLEWITMEHPDEVVVLGEQDYVLDSYFDPEFDAWEALVLLKPDEEPDE